MNSQTRVSITGDASRQYPYNCIGKITVTFQSGQSCQGTVALVTPNIVITSAKLLYHQRFGIDSIKIQFGLQEKIVVNKNLKVFYSDAIRKGYRKTVDYGFIKMKEDLSQQLGCIPLNFYESLQQGNQIQIAGYPLQYNGIPVKEDRKLVSGKGVARVKNDSSGVKFLQYDIETSLGQEGAPILTKVDGQYAIVGIHLNNGDESGNGKFGVYLNGYQRIDYQYWFAEKQADFNYYNNIDLSRFASFCRQRVDSLQVFKLRDTLGNNTKKNQVLDELTALQNLRQIDLAENQLSTFNIQNLTSKIENLDLSSNCFSNQFIESFNSKKWDNLTFIYLDNNQIFRAKFNNDNFPRLKCLSLGHNKLGQEFLKELGQSKFNSLIDLSLEHNPLFENENNQRNFENCSFEELRTLNLSHTGLTKEAITQLGKISLPELGKLIIAENRLGVEELKQLNQSGLFNRIYSLDISENSFKDQFIETLASFEIPRLTCLYLNKNVTDENGHIVGDQSPKFTDHHLEALSKANYFSNLSILQLDFNSLSFFILQKILTSLQTMKIDYISSKYNSNIRDPQVQELVEKIKEKNPNFEIYIQEFEAIQDEDIHKYFDKEEMIDQKDDKGVTPISDASRIFWEEGERMGSSKKIETETQNVVTKEPAKFVEGSPSKVPQSPIKSQQSPNKVTQSPNQVKESPSKASESSQKKESTEKNDIWDEWNLSEKGKDYLRSQQFDLQTLQLMSKQQINDLQIPKADKIKINKKLKK